VNTTIEKIERLNLILLGVCGAVVGIFGWLHFPSFLLGGAVMQLNFWLLKKIVRALVVPAAVQQKRGTLRALIAFLGKLLLSVLLLSGLFLRYPIQIWSFMAGVSLLLVTCMIVTLLESPIGPQAEDNGV
jgi:small-conductance mechanosensitive channel